MNDVADLLGMPWEWERRPEAWQRLIQGYVLFDALRDCVQTDVLEQVIPLLSEWEMFASDPFKQSRGSWQIFCELLACAKIAALKAYTAHEFPELLHVFDPQALLPDVLNCQAASRDKESWRQFLRDSLMRLTWHPPSNAEWAWDAVTTLMGNPRTIVRSESISVLLVENAGITARLTLERLSDEGRGILYRDARTSSFLNWGNQFEEAIQNAVAFTVGQGSWNENERADVRWKLTRDDGKQLTYLDGASAGGAFALCLAKLFAEA